MRSAFIGNKDTIERVYPLEIRQALALEAGLDLETVLSKEDLLCHPERTAHTEFLFSTWGMPSFTEAEIAACFPRAKALYYAAGSVQSFARPFLRRGIRVFSAWAANAVPVAEYAAAQILLANKGYFVAARLCAADYEEAHRIFASFPGNYGCRVGILGAGMIGSLVIDYLRRNHLDILVFDPFLSDEKAASMGVRKTSLKEIFSSCQTISNHLANNDQTVHMLDGRLFSLMGDTVTFLNTGRGQQVVEPDLCEALRQRPLATAVLDVTHPEPPQADHPFRTLPNVILTPHIAGSSGNEVHRMAVYMREEFLHTKSGLLPRWEVTEEMLLTMA